MGRFGRKSRDVDSPSESKSNASNIHVSSDSGSYVPPATSDSCEVVAAANVKLGSSTQNIASPNQKDGIQSAFVHDSSFVTQPPKLAKGLTGKISTLFRREASRERNDTTSYEDPGQSEDFSPSSSTQQDVDAAITQNPQTNHQSPQQKQYRSDELDGQYIYQPKKQQHEVGQQKHKNTSKESRHYVVPRNDWSGASDDQSVGGASVSSKAGSTTKRIFYSSNQDDDSDDSYESRASRVSRSSRTSRGSVDTKSRGIRSGATGVTSADDYSRYGDEETFYSLSELQSANSEAGGIRRYRGFSTSIKSLFLDEPLVCAAMGCFGLILSNRTEYLLQLRNERRGALTPRRGARTDSDGRKKSPSRIVGIGLILTIMLMFSTFIIWGFGSGGDSGDAYLNDYMGGYENFDDQRKNQWWDDYLVNDDDRFGNRNYNKNKNSNDDENAAYNGNYYAASNDDKQDDGGSNANNYNGNKNDDGGDDANRRYLENNNKFDEGILKRRESNATKILSSFDTKYEVYHPFHGIFKIRDYQESVWTPVCVFLKSEWYRGPTDLAMIDNNVKGKQFHRREEANSDNDDTAEDNQGSYTTYNGETNVKSASERDIASDIRIGLLFVFLLFLGILGRRRRMRTRFYLVRARAQDDHLYYASSDEAATRRVAFDDSREDQYEGACSHTLCGCYPADEVEAHPNDAEVEVTDSGIVKRHKKPHHEDSIARGFSCCLYACCGVLCKCWFQCLSICALAQEAREIRLLVPPRYQRIDYITHQPFHEYQEAVNDLRRGWMGEAQKLSGILPHYNALSRFSRWIVVLSLISVGIIISTLYFNPRAAFSWQDAVVLIATFLQSFLVLFIVHGIFHKSDLSLDAVIKMFTAGFVIAVPSAFFFEGLLVNIVLFVVMMVYYLASMIFGDSFGVLVFDHWRTVWIIGELFNAFIVAALVEELCKYYTFRAVEHPDLVFLTGLQREKQNENAVEGGVVQYPFASHQVQELGKEKSFDDASSVSSYRSSGSKRNPRSRKTRKGVNLIEKTGTMEGEFDEDENDVRTHRQKAMAITTGMISVAVGLACAENFLYVFVLGGAATSDDSDAEAERKSNIMEAWIVLFFRSIFPVHALAAAMQSINVIRKFVESDNDGGHRIGVGRIILPAVIVHGSFDAVLMGINVYIETSWDRYLDENEGNIVQGKEPYNTLLVNLVAWISITLIMIAGLLWYFKENRNQRDRLVALEEREKKTRPNNPESSAERVSKGVKPSVSSHTSRKKQSRRSKSNRNDSEFV